jgi:hydrogenase expression/formation protein HypE
MRDPTRGGLATTLCELAESTGFGVVVHEEKIPVRPSVKGFCDMLGFDPLYVANEGKMVIVADADRSAAIIHKIRQHSLGADAAVIGEISGDHRGIVRMTTQIGGTRIVNMLSGDQLPRIC